MILTTLYLAGAKNIDKPDSSGFKFKFELFQIFLFSPICHLVRNFNFLTQVSQSKLRALEIMSGYNFGEFMVFFPKGLNTFKI
jgi:hypothetical protein